jgi:hypothetical protein
MTRLPCISTLFTIHLDGDFRTDKGAKGAAVTVSVRLHGYGMKTLGIQFGGGVKIFVLTDRRTQKAFLAEFPVDFYRSLQWLWTRLVVDFREYETSFLRKSMSMSRLNLQNQSLAT